MNRKADFFYKTNLFESVRLTNRIEYIRIANWNALTVYIHLLQYKFLRTTIISLLQGETIMDKDYVVTGPPEADPQLISLA